MRQNKVISFAVAMTLTLSSSLSLAASPLKQYEAMPTQELQAQLKYNRTALDNVAIESRSNDALLTILEKEQFMTPVQTGANLALKGGILAAVVGTPLYLLDKIEKAQFAENSIQDDVIKKLDKEAWSKAYEVHREYLNELTTGYNRLDHDVKYSVMRERLLTRAEQISSRFDQSFTPLLQKELNAMIGRHTEHVTFERNFVSLLSEQIAHKTRYTPEIESELKQYMQKYESRNAKANRTKVGLFLTAIGGGIWWIVKTLTSDLQDSDEKTYEYMKDARSAGNTTQVQNIIDNEIVKRAALADKAMNLQEHIFIIETVLMMRGESVE